MHNISSLWCFRFFSNFLIIWKLKLYFWNFLEQKNALTIEQQQGSVSNFVYLVFSITRKILQALKKHGQCIYLLLTISWHFRCYRVRLSGAKSRESSPSGGGDRSLLLHQGLLHRQGPGSETLPCGRILEWPRSKMQTWVENLYLDFYICIMTINKEFKSITWGTLCQFVG